MTTFQICADVEYLDGPLAGLRVPHGYRVTMPTHSDVARVLRWLQRVRDTHDFVRAVVTGHRYRIVGEISVNALNAA